MTDLHVRRALGPALAAALGDDAWRDLEAELIVGGKSNLTYRLRSAAGEVILRRPPDGAVRATAHDMGREIRVQKALARTPVPVPLILLDQPWLLAPSVTRTLGFPRRAEIAAWYAEATGADLSHLTVHLALAHLKFAVITEDIDVRVRSGAMAGQDFGDLTGEAARIAEAGLDVLGKV